MDTTDPPEIDIVGLWKESIGWKEETRIVLVVFDGPPVFASPASIASASSLIGGSANILTYCPPRMASSSLLERFMVFLQSAGDSPRLGGL